MKYFLLVFVCFLLWCMCQCIRKPINLKLCLLEIVFYYFLTEVSDSTHKSVDVIESPDTKQSPTPAKLMQSIQCSGVLLPLPALYHQSGVWSTVLHCLPDQSIFATRARAPVFSSSIKLTINIQNG